MLQNLILKVFAALALVILISAINDLRELANSWFKLFIEICIRSRSGRMSEDFDNF